MSQLKLSGAIKKNAICTLSISVGYTCPCIPTAVCSCSGDIHASADSRGLSRGIRTNCLLT